MNFLKYILALAVLMSLPAHADIVPGGDGSPATFPSGVSMGTATVSDLDYGQYTPTYTDDGQPSTITPSANPVNWLRVGDMVSLSGVVSATCSGAGIGRLRMELPVATAMTDANDARGVLYSNGSSDTLFSLFAETGPGDEVKLQITCSGAGSRNWFFSFQYIVK